MTFPSPFLHYLLCPSIALPKCSSVVPRSWLRLDLRATGTGSLFSPVYFSLSPSSKVLSHRQGFFSPVSVRGANLAVVLILLGPEEMINWFVYSL